MSGCCEGTGMASRANSTTVLSKPIIAVPLVKTS